MIWARRTRMYARFPTLWTFCADAGMTRIAVYWPNLDYLAAQPGTAGAFQPLMGLFAFNTDQERYSSRESVPKTEIPDTRHRALQTRPRPR
jgi:hypothetical protein